MGLEEIESLVQLVFVDDVYREHSGVHDVLMGGRIGLYAHCHQWRREGSLGNPVDGGRTHILSILALRGQDEHTVGNHA